MSLGTRAKAAATPEPFGFLWRLTVSIAWATVLVLGSATDAWMSTAGSALRRLEYQTRDRLGRAPRLAKSLKIFGLDDVDVAFLRSSEISLHDLAGLISGFSARHPRAIVIDKVFSLLPDDPRGLAELQAALAANPLVHAGAYLSPTPNPWRAPLPRDAPAYSLARLAPDGSAGSLAIGRFDTFAFGPDPRLREGFRGIGHLSVGTDGEIAALINLSERSAIPYLGLSAAGALRVTGGMLTVGDRWVPLSRDGKLTLNLSSAAEYYGRTQNLRVPIARVRQGLPLLDVDPDDTVLILPLMYSGNVDLELTPVGRLPRGFFLASVLSSQLTGTWLRVAADGYLLTFLAAALGVVGGITAAGYWFWLLLTLSSAGIIGAGLLSFAYLDLVSSWGPAAIAHVLAALTAFAVSRRALEREARGIKLSLGTALPKNLLQALLNDPGTLRREAAERVVTLMFIDIVGFSTFAERTSPAQVFADLKTLLARLTVQVHNHGGVVDKTLGDGMLCFFGYQFDGAPSATNQADQAIACALAIQQENAAALVQGQFSLPLRIGLNTASVYIGDLGNSERLDFTVIGDGVNLAKRFESACDPFSTLMAQATLDLSRYDITTPGLRYRHIQIKHHHHLVKAVEFDPFEANPGLRLALGEALRGASSIPQRAQRWPVLQTDRYQVTVNGTAAQLVDFSHRGLSLRTADYFAKGVVVTVGLQLHTAGARAGAEALGLTSLIGEIRWGRPHDAAYLHGILLKHLNEVQGDLLLNILRTCMGTSGGADVGQT